MWILLYPETDNVDDLKILILDDPKEHTEINGADDIPGLFFNAKDVLYDNGWEPEMNSNPETGDYEFFGEFTSYVE